MFKKSSDPADYCIIDASSESRLSAFERLTLTGGGELERALERISDQVSTLSEKQLVSNLSISSLQQASQLYSLQTSEWAKSASNFFKTPSETLQVTATPFHGLPDGEIVDLRFRSAYQPHHQHYQDQLDLYPENKNVYVRMWKHSQAAKTTIVAIHGWTMGDQRVNSLAFLPGVFYRLGLDVALIELPFHGRRRSKAMEKDDSSVNGFLFPSANIIRTNEAMAQIISDLRSLRQYLQALGVQNVGCMGMSLGAYVGSLWATLDELAFCIPIVPLASMAELSWEVLSRQENFAELVQQGLSFDLLQQCYAVHCPLSYKPCTLSSRVFIIAGLGDKIVPSRQPKLLWDHWKRAKILWYGGGHAAQFKKSQAFENIIEFLKQLNLVNS